MCSKQTIVVKGEGLTVITDEFAWGRDIACMQNWKGNGDETGRGRDNTSSEEWLEMWNSRHHYVIFAIHVNLVGRHVTNCLRE
jgi:hypothetical protein